MKYKISVNLENTDKFNEILGVIKCFTQDQRIQVEVRNEYKEKLIAISQKSKS